MGASGQIRRKTRVQDVFSEHSVHCSIMGLLQYEFMSPLI